MDFIKLQATGNDFVLIDARRMKRDWAALAKAMCDRNFGVGADGLLLILPSKVADFYMRMFNPDGSEAEACGNGLRCAARYAEDNGLAKGPEIKIQTPAGMKIARIKDNKKNIQIAMGKPILAPTAIPVIVDRRGARDTAPVIDYPLTVGKMKLKITCVSMGNPHAVCFLEQPIDDFALTEVGPKVEYHPMFPNRVNFEIVNVLSRSSLWARVWERGAGETLSCGTGACAIAVAARLKKLTDNPVDIILPGGTLTVDWDGKGEMLLSGPAEIVFEGKWKD